MERGGEIHKVLLSTVFFFNRKKDQNKRFAEGEDTGVHGRDGMSACEGGGEGGGVGGGGEKQRC